MNKEKFYPKLWIDKGGKKFSFHYWDKHFTMRFSWKPMILVEKYFILFWGDKTIFMEIWDLAYNKKEIPYELKPYLPFLQKAVKRVEELSDVFDLCDDDQKSPFVIYVNNYNPYK